MMSRDTDQIKEIAGDCLAGNFHYGPLEDKLRLIQALADRISDETSKPQSVTPEWLMLNVRAGLLDEHLEEILRWIRLRQDTLALDRVSELVIGDRIRISKSVTPKMLANIECEVIGFEGTDKVKVKLLVGVSSKWRHGQITTLSKGLVGKKVL